MTGKHTREQQKRIINRQEKTKGSEAPSPNETLAEARRKAGSPPTAYDMRTGDRSIRRGANDEEQHHKNRSD